MLPLAFTTDPRVQAALAGALVVVAIGQPLSGWVFVLDGVLIGAGDARWLAVMQLALLLAYLPIAVVVRAARQRRGHAVVGVHALDAAARRGPGLAGPQRRLAGHRRHPLTRVPSTAPAVLQFGR